MTFFRISVNSAAVCLSGLSLVAALTACSGSGGGGTAPVTTASSKKILYVGNFGGNSIWVYNVNAASPSDSAFVQAVSGGGMSPQTLLIHPTKKFLYALNRNSTTITSFSIDGTTGKLTETGTVSAPGFSGVISPNGKFLYSVYYSTAVKILSIDPTNGVLTSQGSGPTLAGGAISTLAMTSNGNFLFAADTTSNQLYRYAVAADGTLTVNGSPSALAANTMAVTINGVGTVISTADYGGNKVTNYALDSASGALSSTTTININNPVDLLYNTGGTLFAMTYASASINTYSFTAPSTFSAVSTFTQINTPQKFDIDSSQKILAATSGGGGVFFYSLDASGVSGLSGYIASPPGASPIPVRFLDL